MAFFPLFWQSFWADKTERSELFSASVCFTLFFFGTLVTVKSVPMEAFISAESHAILWGTIVSPLWFKSFGTICVLKGFSCFTADIFSSSSWRFGKLEILPTRKVIERNYILNILWKMNLLLTEMLDLTRNYVSVAYATVLAFSGSLY